MSGQEQQVDVAVQRKEDVAAALAKAKNRPKVDGLVEFNPMESIPTIAIGDDIQKGDTIGGTFLETERLSSPKFTLNPKLGVDPATGYPVQLRHILKLQDGSKMGIWSSGELKTAFERFSPGEYVELTYNGKGKNAKGQDQHMFTWKRTPPAAH